MRIGFIGAGKVGRALGRLLAESGLEDVRVVGYASRSAESARRAAQLTGTVAFDSPIAVLEACDTVFLTVPDGAIATVFEELAAQGIAGRTLVHCSGALTVTEVFPGIAELDATGLAIHPLFPMSDSPECYQELRGAWACVEGPEAALHLWRPILERLGLHVQPIAPETKAAYHAACAISSNLVCALVEESVELLGSCGFGRAEALAALAPLARANLEHVLEVGPVAALTGPVERGDVATVERHLAALPTTEETELYRSVSAKLVAMARMRNPERDYDALEALLGERES